MGVDTGIFSAYAGLTPVSSGVSITVLNRQKRHNREKYKNAQNDRTPAATAGKYAKNRQKAGQGGLE